MLAKVEGYYRVLKSEITYRQRALLSLFSYHLAFVCFVVLCSSSSYHRTHYKQHFTHKIYIFSSFPFNHLATLFLFPKVVVVVVMMILHVVMKRVMTMMLITSNTKNL
jgi:hypothetical protein